MRYRNLAEILPRHAEQLGSKVAVRFKRDGRYQDLTWAEYRDSAFACAAALVEAGIKPGDRVGLLGENRVEWMIADIAILTAAAVTVVAAFVPECAADPLSDARCRRPMAVRVLGGPTGKGAAGPWRIAGTRGRCRVRRDSRGDRCGFVGRLSRSRQERAGPRRAGTREAHAATGHRRPGDDHVHVRHHRRPEGRDADALQSGEQRRKLPGGRTAGSGRCQAVLASAQSHLCPNRRSLRTTFRRHANLPRRECRDGCRQYRGDPADPHFVRAALLREVAGGSRLSRSQDHGGETARRVRAAHPLSRFGRRAASRSPSSRRSAPPVCRSCPDMGSPKARRSSPSTAPPITAKEPSARRCPAWR